MSTSSFLRFKALAPGATAKSEDAAARFAAPGPDTPRVAVFKHGQRVRFVHGCPKGRVEVHGEGVIVASGRHGVIVQTDDGVEHKIRFSALG